MRHLIFFFLTGTAFFLAGCSSSPGNSAREPVLQVALFDNPTNLDPRTYSDVVSYKIIEQVFDFLVRPDSTGVPRPELATSWETPSDTVYLFHLRKGVRFHDGSLLSAYDVAYTFRSVLDPALKAPLRKSLEVIKAITVLDSFRIKFTLAHPHAPFLSNLEVGIVPRHLAEPHPEQFKQHPVGSGPFQFVRWEPDALVVLKRNPYYWRGRPGLSEIQMKIIPEATTRVLALENGEVDFLMNNFPERYLPRLRANPRLKVLTRTGSNYVYIGLNLRNPYLKKLAVRQALAYAINVPEMISSLTAGLHTRATSLLYPGNWAHNPNLQPYPYDPEKARALLNRAGYPDPDGDGPAVRFTLTYKCTDKLQSRQKAQVIQQYLGRVGIGVKIQSYEWGTFFDDVQHGRFDLYSLTWVGVYEPDIYYRLFHSSSIGTGANRGAYRNPVVDRLLEQAQQILELNKRKALYWKVQEILHRELPYISLWYETNVAVMDRRLAGFELYPAGEWKSFWKVHFLQPAVE